MLLCRVSSKTQTTLIYFMLLLLRYVTAVFVVALWRRFCGGLWKQEAKVASMDRRFFYDLAFFFFSLGWMDQAGTTAAARRR